MSISATTPGSADAVQADTVHADVEHYLSSLEWQVGSARRVSLSHSEQLDVDAADAALVYVISGSVAVSFSPAPQSCSGDSPAQSLPPCAGGLDAGDIVLATSCAQMSIEGSAAAHIAVATLNGAPGSAAAISRLPRCMIVRDFDRSEPAIAGLAANLGGDCELHQKTADSVVCSLVVTTVVAAATRTWMERGCAPEDWFVRTRDPFIAQALAAMQHNLQRPWSVADLAKIATMSRSTFAARFRTLLGVSPMEYLMQLRMAQAEEHLSRGDRSISETSRLLGYESDEGFSRAFTRYSGVSPSRWRQSHRTKAAENRTTPPTPVIASRDLSHR